MDKLNEITAEDLFMTTEEALEWVDWSENTIYDKGIKIGLTQGKIKGIKEGNQETSKEYIKSMVENNIELDIISKITNKTIEEIKEIINKD